MKLPHTEMRPMGKAILNRREAVAALLAISASSALVACNDATEAGGTAEVSADYADEGVFFSASELALIGALANTVIPDTDTPGAVAAGVPEVIQGLASDWGDDNYRKYLRGGIAGLGKRLRADAGRDFADLSPARRESLLARIDADAFAPAEPVPAPSGEETAYGDAEDMTAPAEVGEAADRRRREAGRNFYRDFKNTVATAYYMSEVGATEELAYEAVPGEWIGDAPLSQYPKTWAT